MTLSSVSFFVFMLAVFLIYWGIPHKFRYLLLICANLSFYGSFGVKCLPILIGEALIVYVAGLVLDRNAQKPGMKGSHNGEVNNCKSNITRKVMMIAFVILALSPLLIFKYLNFSIYAVQKILSFVSIQISDHTLMLLAPIGVSFYTFESLSYIIDVYKGKITAEKNVLKLFAFISFFPSITSGPIERAEYFIPQLDNEKNFEYEEVVYGLRLILLGMFKKICGANVLKQYVDAVFGNIYAYKGPAFIIAVILYTYEIYLDFSGYTDMVRGFALMLGFKLTENFKAPYLSVGIKEFFSRWHISLSSWLKDYVYIPLGGSRCSRLRKYINLIVTMLVSGIWHGASFTFIVWGLLHGVYQCIADLLKKYTTKFYKWVRIVISFVLVSFAWLFFRANSLSDAKYIVKNMLFGDNFYGQMLQMGFLTISAYLGVILIIGLTIIYDIISEKKDIIEILGKQNTLVRWGIYIIMGVLILVFRSHIGASADFIYFKF